MVLFKRVNIPHGMFFTLFSLFLLISTISILGLGIFWISTGKMAIEITAKRQFAIIATRVGSEIEGIVNTPLNTLNYIATLSHTLPSKDLFKKGFLVDLTIKYPFLKRIAYIGMDGREEINTDLEGVLRDRSREPAFLTAIKGKTYISEVYINSENIPMMTIAIPVKRLGETIRVLMAQVSLKEMWDLIDGIHIGKGSRVWLVSKEDRLIAYPDKKWVLKGRDMGYHPAIKALASGTHSLHYRDETGEEYLAYAHLLPNLGWKLVIERPTKEIFLSVSHLRHQAVFWGGINFLLALALSYWFSKRLTRPIIAVAKGA
ncbi:MAG: cache domain-containing protein, partial [Deltaproteobacteria bacterium]|nr:cache domain-containing protein [Deltaproteobacteria bacterium]